MSIIKTVNEAEATGRTAGIYAQDRKARGYVPSLMRVLSVHLAGRMEGVAGRDRRINGPAPLRAEDALHGRGHRIQALSRPVSARAFATHYSKPSEATTR